MSSVWLPCGDYHQNYAEDHGWWQTRFLKGKMLLLLLTVFVGIPLFADEYLMSVGTMIGYTAMGALGVQLLIGYSGLLTLGHAAFNALTNFASGVRVTDSQSGYRAFSPRALEAIHFSSEGFSVESEMQFLAQEHGLRLKEVPISISYRDRAKRPVVTHGLRVLNGVRGWSCSCWVSDGQGGSCRSTVPRGSWPLGTPSSACFSPFWGAWPSSAE